MPKPGVDVFAETRLRDEHNLAMINDAFNDGRIDSDTRDYLTNLYSNSMDWFREVFLSIGKCFGAPKAAVRAYDYATDTVIDTPITISDINPLEPYLVNHRLDADPMRNQFFKTTHEHNIDLAVSSIVTVIVGAQKSISRALDKITGKYYTDYVADVAKTAADIISNNGKSASAVAISDKIYDTFSKNYITHASETVLGIIGLGHTQIAAELVRELDKIATPYERLCDVWRIKCLFDLVPQARAFIDSVCNMWPDKIINVKDKFFDITNPRGYRDAKLVLNIGTKENVVPMEIICQVRTFFEFEHQTHGAYEKLRRGKSKLNKHIDDKTENLHLLGVKKYNEKISLCVEDLFDRIGWNILYSAGNEDRLFDGFPVLSRMYYPQKITDTIFEKVDNAVENEVFFVENAPTKLTKDQEIRIFRWMAKFILITAMPYSYADWEIQNNTMAGKFFNFIMKELQRYYKK